MMYRIMKPFTTGISMSLKAFITATIIAVVPIIILGLSTYWIASESLTDEFRASNRETMRQIQERIDDKLTNLDRIMLQHAFSPIIDKFLSAPNPQLETELFSDTMNILNSLEVLIKDVDSVMLYRKDLGIVMTPHIGAVDESILHPSILERIKQFDRPFFWVDHVPESNVRQEGSYMVSLVRSLPVTSTPPQGYLIVNIDDNMFFDIFQNMQIGRSGNMVIVTPEGNVYHDSENQLLKENFDLPFIRKIAESSKTNDTFTETVNGQKMLINYLESSYNGWKYITFIPYRELMNRLIHIRTITFAICSVLLLLSLLFSLLLSRKFQKMFRVILSRFNTALTEDTSEQSTKDELHQIAHYIDNLHSRHLDMEKQAHNSIPLLRSLFLQNLLAESVSETAIEEKMRYYRLNMPFPCYTVLCIDLDRLRAKSERDIQLFLYAVSNMADEIVAIYSNNYAVTIKSDQVVIIINHEEEKLEEHRRDIATIAHVLQGEVEQVLKIIAIVGIGNSYSGTDSIRHSYLDALEALRSRVSESESKIIDIRQVSPDMVPAIYPTEQEQQIITNLKLANLERIQELTGIFAELLVGRNSGNADYIRQSFAQLISVSLRTLYELSSEESASPFSYNPYERLGTFKTSQQIVDWLTGEIYPVIIKHIQNRQHNRHQSEMDTVQAYIHSHYNEDLSMPEMAEMASMSLFTFSNKFKKHTGMSFTDYLIAFRIEKAKDLLLETEMKIAEISEHLRYQNPQNFIRVFKRITGMTPGEYRSRE